jgi:hypothetical protein
MGKTKIGDRNMKNQQPETKPPRPSNLALVPLKKAGEFDLLLINQNTEMMREVRITTENPQELMDLIKDLCGLTIGVSETVEGKVLTPLIADKQETGG